MDVFSKFLETSKRDWRRTAVRMPGACFVVGKVGTDTPYGFFDPVVARQLASTVAECRSFIKGHYTDDVENPEEYPMSGMGARTSGLNSPSRNSTRWKN